MTDRMSGGDEQAGSGLPRKNHGFLLVLCGPSGAGKGTVVSGLMARENQYAQALEFSVSMTTRSARPGESEGKNYYFVSREMFEERIKAGALLEYAEYAGNLYGTPRDAVERAVENGKVVLLEIEVRGALQVKKTFPDAVMVFIMPPTFEELEQRLLRRATETQEVIAKRLAIAREEYQSVSAFEYYVQNDTVSGAVLELDSIICAERCKVKRRLGEL